MAQHDASGQRDATTAPDAPALREAAGHEAPLDVLLEAPRVEAARGRPTPSAIVARYGGTLEVPLRARRPTLIANFVESIDGVVALATGPGGGGSDISGSSEPDRFVMALLRSIADAVVVGAGTVRSAPTHEWTPRAIAPAWESACDEWRASLGLPPQPTTVVVSAAGDVPSHHPGLASPDVPVIIATTSDGAETLTRRGVPGQARVEVVADEGPIRGDAIVALLGRAGVRLALCEGGPHLLSDLLDGDALDELFLTLAPQVLGRAETFTRFGLAEGHAWEPETARWAEIVSVRRAGSHLFLRYAFELSPDGRVGRRPDEGRKAKER